LDVGCFPTRAARLDPRVRSTMDFLCRHFDHPNQKLSLHLLAKNAIMCRRGAYLSRRQAGWNDRAI
jgi:hypothetical protein